MHRFIVVFLVPLVLAACLLSMPASAERSPEMQDLARNAQTGDPVAQYLLGMIFLDEKNPVEAYAWLSLAHRQQVEGADVALAQAEGMLYSPEELAQAKKKADDYYAQHVEPFKHPFQIKIGHKIYEESGEVPVTLPVRALFHHINPFVTLVRVQKPGNPESGINLDVDHDYNFTSRLPEVKQGGTSVLEFLAIDGQGRIYGEMTLTFVPGPSGAPE